MRYISVNLLLYIIYVLLSTQTQNDKCKENKITLRLTKYAIDLWIEKETGKLRWLDQHKSLTRWYRLVLRCSIKEKRMTVLFSLFLFPVGGGGLQLRHIRRIHLCIYKKKPKVLNTSWPPPPPQNNNEVLPSKHAENFSLPAVPFPKLCEKKCFVEINYFMASTCIFFK